MDNVVVTITQARRDPWIALSLGFVLIVTVSAALTPWLSPYSAGGLEEQRILEAPSGWAPTVWAGTF
jgi:hypothetical protein